MYLHSYIPACRPAAEAVTVADLVTQTSAPEVQREPKVQQGPEVLQVQPAQQEPEAQRREPEVRQAQPETQQEQRCLRKAQERAWRRRMKRCLQTKGREI